MNTVKRRYDAAIKPAMTSGRGARYYATPGRRRAIATASVLLTVVFVATLVTDGWWTPIAAFVILIPLCLTFSLMNLATQGWSELSTESLDERQVAERNAASAGARWWGVLLLAVAVPGAALLLDGGLVERYDLIALTIGTGLLYLTLPSLVWMVRSRAVLDVES